MPVSQIKSLFEQIAEKFGSNSNVQVIQGSLEEVLAQLKAEAGEVAETVGKAATQAADTGLNVVQQLIADLNAQFGGEGVEISHRSLSEDELEAELLALLEGEEGDDERDLEDLSKQELIDFVLLQDETLEIAGDAIEAQRAQLESQAEQIAHLEATVNLQAQLLEHSNAQLTATHEGVAQLRGLLENLKGANARLDAAQDRTRTISFADIINGLKKR